MVLVSSYIEGNTKDHQQTRCGTVTPQGVVLPDLDYS